MELKRDNLSRFNFNSYIIHIEIVLVDIGELTTRELAKKHKPIALDENRKIAKEGGK